MNAIMNQINARLKDEIESYRELLGLVQEEKEILLSGNHDRLFELSEKKLSVSGRLLKQQTERAQAHVGFDPQRRRHGQDTGSGAPTCLWKAGAVSAKPPAP